MVAGPSRPDSPGRHLLHIASSERAASRWGASAFESLAVARSGIGTPWRVSTSEDQGSQFTSADFVGVLKDAKVRISMDGRGRFLDNIFIERLWRSLKYEAVYDHLPTPLQRAARTELG